MSITEHNELFPGTDSRILTASAAEATHLADLSRLIIEKVAECAQPSSDPTAGPPSGPSELRSPKQQWVASSAKEALKALLDRLASTGSSQWPAHAQRLSTSDEFAWRMIMDEINKQVQALQEESWHGSLQPQSCQVYPFRETTNKDAALCENMHDKYSDESKRRASFVSDTSDVIDRLEAADGQHNLVVVASRNVNSEAVRSQRVEAAVASRGLNQFARGQTRTALQDEPSSSTMRGRFQKMATSLRLSRMGTMKRDQMIKEVTAAAPQQGLKGASLETRLATFGMQMLEMEGDGNCQFRSMAFNLFGKQDYHASPRQAAVRHMKKHSDFFGVFFETAAEFSRYLQNMARNGTWGDELTLRAVVEAYGCIAHVVTSEPANWHLVQIRLGTPTGHSYWAGFESVAKNLGRHLHRACGGFLLSPPGLGAAAGVGRLNHGVELLTRISEGMPQYVLEDTRGFALSCVVPNRLVGGIIGRGGSGTKEVQQLTNTKIGIRDIPGDAEHRSLNIAGPLPNACAAYMLMMKRYLDSEAQAPGGYIN
ncbi:OTU11 [Symbiodinium pilosum]|uniref:OTU11 protein n=1 Tax=Symbiodinium pilosum TaxID=2952 RepID=A0A812W6S5_SYMPI|nr:OTU11 [Symbiodinium pilosum]